MKVFQLFWWEQRESNPRPSACKADALNQLSYAPVSFLFADNCVRLRIFSRSLPQGNSLLQSLSSLFSTKINCNIFAVRTGLEPATPGVTGRYSNQLNYRTICSDLCVFLERGCKGTHFFETSKYFLHFFQKIFTFRLVSTKSSRFCSKVAVLWVRQHKITPFLF